MGVGTVHVHKAIGRFRRYTSRGEYGRKHKKPPIDSTSGRLFMVLDGKGVFEFFHAGFQVSCGDSWRFLAFSFFSMRLRNCTTGFPQSAQNSDANKP